MHRAIGDNHTIAAPHRQDGDDADAATPRWSRAAAALLAVEGVLLIGFVVALFVYARLHPAQFEWGQQLLDARLGAVAAALLFAGSVMTTLAASARRDDQTRRMKIALTFAIACGIAFFACFGIDYAAKWQHHLLPGRAYHPTRTYLASMLGRPLETPGELQSAPKTAAAAIADTPAKAPDADQGKKLFLETCAACHGPRAQGLPHQGAPLRTSKFIAAQKDGQLLAFIKNGRQPGDPSSVMGLAMPARGGNPALDDAKLRDVIAFLRVMQKDSPQPNSPSQTAAGSSGATSQPSAVAQQASNELEALVAPKSLIAPIASATAGILSLHPRPVASENPVTPPPDAPVFFSLYFVITGLYLLIATVAVLLALRALVRLRTTPDQHQSLPPLAVASRQWWLATCTWAAVLAIVYGL